MNIQKRRAGIKTHDQPLEEVATELVGCLVFFLFVVGFFFNRSAKSFSLSQGKHLTKAGSLNLIKKKQLGLLLYFR